MARLLLAWLMFFALTLGPVLPASATLEQSGIEGKFVICHADPGDAPTHAPAKEPGFAGDCQLCPACHLVMTPALPAAGTGFVEMPKSRPARLIPWAPPATGPPRVVSPATPPTGPPAASV